MVVTLLLVGALLTPLALTARWARDTITSTDGYVAAADRLAADDDVREALVDHLTAIVLEQIDSALLDSALLDSALIDSALVDDALAALGGSGDGASRLDAAGGSLRLAIEPLVREVLTRVVDSDAFAAVWSEANRRAHTTALALLTRGDAGALNLSDDGQVTLDLAPVVDLARAELLARGIPLAASIPQLDVSVPVVSSQELVKARTSYAVLDAVADWLPWVVALMLISAVLLARARAAVLAWEAGIIVVGTALVSLAVVVVRSASVESLTGSRLRTEVTAVIADVLGDSALGALRVGYALGAVLAVAAVVVWVAARVVGRRRTQPARG